MSSYQGDKFRAFGEEYARQYLDHMSQEFEELEHVPNDGERLEFWEGFIEKLSELVEYE